MTDPEHRHISKDSFLEPRPPYSLVWTWKHSHSQNRWWEQLGSLGQLFYNQCSDPRVCQAHSLDIGPLSDLLNGTLRVNGFGRLFSRPQGYIVIRVQVEGGQGYNEDQVVLVIPDPNDFGFQVPVTLGMLTINWIINVIKESEIDELSVSLSGLRISHLLACHWAELSIGSGMAANQTMEPNDLKKAVKREDINAFCKRSYTPKQRPCFWAATCMWWHRPWGREMDPVCLMAWASWIPIMRWLQGVSKLQ